MATVLSKTWEKAGDNPGQKISVQFEFLSRNINAIEVRWTIYAKDLGNFQWNKDRFWNVGTFNLKGKDLNQNIEVDVYQVWKGSSFTFTGKTIIPGVANGVTSLEVYYSNVRKSKDGTIDTNGNVPKTLLGSIEFPDNSRYDLTFHTGLEYKFLKYPNFYYVHGLPVSWYGKYYNWKFQIPGDKLVDPSNHYVFTQQYSTVQHKWHHLHPYINIGPGDYWWGYNKWYWLHGPVRLYACWKPQTYLYSFYKDSEFTSQFNSLSATWTWKEDPTVLPDLSILNKQGTERNEYYKAGYQFSGWASDVHQISEGKTDSVVVSMPELKCTADWDAKFYPIWEPIDTDYVFDYGYDNYTRTYKNQKPIDPFDFSLTKVSENGSITRDDEYVNIKIRPGYKLIGWTLSKELSSTIYTPGSAPTDYRVYKVDNPLPQTIAFETMDNADISSNGITFYAVWEYYSMLYVYSKKFTLYNGRQPGWQMCMPIIYTNGEWKLATTKMYVRVKKSEDLSELSWEV